MLLAECLKKITIHAWRQRDRVERQKLFSTFEIIIRIWMACVRIVLLIDKQVAKINKFKSLYIFLPFFFFFFRIATRKVTSESLIFHERRETRGRIVITKTRWKNRGIRSIEVAFCFIPISRSVAEI